MATSDTALAMLWIAPRLAFLVVLVELVLVVLQQLLEVWRVCRNLEVALLSLHTLVDDARALCAARATRCLACLFEAVLDVLGKAVKDIL